MREPHHPSSAELELPAVLHALSDPARLQIVRRLWIGDECRAVGGAGEAGLSQRRLSCPEGLGFPRVQMGRLGLEPRTNGLTIPHRLSPAASYDALRAGPSLHPRLDVRVGGVWPLRALRLPGLPADCPIPRIVTVSVPRALRVFQQTAADQPAVSLLALLSTKVRCSTH